VAPAKGIQDLLNRAGLNQYFFQEKTVDIISCNIHVNSGIFCRKIYPSGRSMKRLQS